MAKIQEISYKQFPLLHRLASYKVFSWQPAVYRKASGGYGIRILESEAYNHRSGSKKMNWDYFELEEDGLIITSPRGMAKQFNKRVRITDMPAMVKKYKDKVINQ